MKTSPILFTIVLAWLRLLLTTGSPEIPANSGATELKRAVIANYASMVSAGYQDSLDSAKKLQSAVAALLGKASEETLTNARQAWLTAHQRYSLTETFRFYNGPIDELEVQVNSWPIDASYIDSVADAPDSGIINAVSAHPAISRALLVSLNAKDGEQNISTGFHAIEFLLWGEPPGGRGAGNRSWMDFADSGKNFLRRREYLRVVTDLLIEHLQTTTSAWASSGSDNFRAKFVATDLDTALANILMGMGALSGPELSGERLTTAYETKERGEQQSCFSNSTCDDLIANAIGIQNVLMGSYTSSTGLKTEGPGLFDLLRKADTGFAEKLSAQIAASVTALQKIPQPFDQAILGTNQSPNRIAMKKAINALQTQSTMIAQAARVLSVKMNL